MDVSGKIIVFVEKRTAGDKEFNNYKGTISHKLDEGKRVNSSIGIRFDGTNFKEEDMIKKLDDNHCYELEVTKGWLDTRTFQRRDGSVAHEIFIFVKEGKILKAKKVNKIEKEEPSNLDFVVEE